MCTETNSYSKNINFCSILFLFCSYILSAERSWINRGNNNPDFDKICCNYLHTFRGFVTDYHMFTNNQRQEERTGKYGTPRVQYLQQLVGQFQNASSEELKEKIVANLANFAYDPYNYTFLRQLNVLELFLDCITEPNEKLIEFGAGGICNSCVDPANAEVIIKCDGVPLLIQCLSSPVKNTVNYALVALYYLCNASTKEVILQPEVVDVIKRYAAAGAVSVSFRNLAQAFIDKHL